MVEAPPSRLGLVLGACTVDWDRCSMSFCMLLGWVRCWADVHGCAAAALHASPATPNVCVCPFPRPFSSVLGVGVYACITLSSQLEHPRSPALHLILRARAHFVWLVSVGHAWVHPPPLRISKHCHHDFLCLFFSPPLPPGPSGRPQLTSLGSIPVTEAAKVPKWKSGVEPQPATKDELSGLTFSKAKLFAYVRDTAATRGPLFLCAALPNSAPSTPLVCV
jgi:hypothetical protein